MTSRSTEIGGRLSRAERTVHVALSEVDFQRLVDVSARAGTTPTQLAGAVIVTSVDQLAESQEVM